MLAHLTPQRCLTRYRQTIRSLADQVTMAPTGSKPKITVEVVSDTVW